jgi:hypothetical protein
VTNPLSHLQRPLVNQKLTSLHIDQLVIVANLFLIVCSSCMVYCLLLLPSYVVSFWEWLNHVTVCRHLTLQATRDAALGAPRTEQRYML